MRYFLLAVSLVSSAGLPATGYQTSSLAATQQKRPASAKPLAHYRLGNGLRAAVQGHEITITNAAGAVVARNARLIRLADDARACPLDGFSAIVSKGNYFTIEQQNCAGWFFINEYITFRYVPGTGKIQLHKVGLAYTDRREPNKDISSKVFTNKQFGERYFSQVTLETLEALQH
jgi:hypothetical protein